MDEDEEKVNHIWFRRFTDFVDMIRKTTRIECASSISISITIGLMERYCFGHVKTHRGSCQPQALHQKRPVTSSDRSDSRQMITCKLHNVCLPDTNL